MQRRLMLTLVLLLAAGCAFDPSINARAVRCHIDDDDSCPAGYVCPGGGHHNEQRFCCPDLNGDRLCDDAVDASMGSSDDASAADDGSASDGTTDGTTDGTDHHPLDAPSDAGPTGAAVERGTTNLLNDYMVVTPR